jgi:hypothetical protein
LSVRLEAQRKITGSALFHALSRLAPGVSTLKDLYRLAGYPSRRKEGILKSYGKYPDIQ